MMSEMFQPTRKATALPFGLPLASSAAKAISVLGDTEASRPRTTMARRSRVISCHNLKPLSAAQSPALGRIDLGFPPESPAEPLDQSLIVPASATAGQGCRSEPETLGPPSWLDAGSN